MRSRFHHDDIVEDIATKRQGKINAISRYIVEGREGTPHQWRVHFLDGTDPQFQEFTRLYRESSWCEGTHAALPRACSF